MRIFNTGVSSVIQKERVDEEINMVEKFDLIVKKASKNNIEKEGNVYMYV
jgi:hypothetical protein